MLQEKIENQTAKVGIIGQGYVGLPHALDIARAGFFVYGLDISQNRVDSLNQAKSYIDDVTDEDLREIIGKNLFKASTDFQLLAETDVVMICVPTPLDKYKLPDVSYIESAGREIAKTLHSGQLIILESTSYPGTTEEVLLPILEKTGLKAGVDFHLAFAPERIDPGNKMPLNEITKVVGGLTEKCGELTASFYGKFLKHTHRVSSTRAAEMCKILENTFRLINISMINEMALLCGKMNLDIWEIIEAAKTKPYGFMPFYPSAKIGGHCIPLDPFYLSYKAKEYGFWPRFIELAGEINELMPHSVVTKVAYALNLYRKSISGSRILIWGVSYKKDIGDVRESSCLDIIPDLWKKGAQVDFYDPFVEKVKFTEKDLTSITYTPEILKNYDLVLILTDHSNIDYNELALNANLVVDTRNAIKSRKYKHVFGW